MIGFLWFLYENWGLIAGLGGLMAGPVLLLLGRKLSGWIVLAVAAFLLVGWGVLTARGYIVTLINRADKAEAQLSIVTAERDFCKAERDLTADEVRKANANALEAATACTSTLEYMARSARVAKQVRATPAGSDPSAVYARSLCERPEARDDAACR